MKKFVALAVVALLCVACKKEETPGEKLDGAIEKAGEKADAMKDALKK
jgi:hypothetical protein